VISGGFVTDLGVEWDVLKEEEYTLTMLMDVNNVFDESQEVSVTEGEASRGRSFYAGFRCEF
jgi:outer membrane receptor protein involved in Fe transport